MVRAAKTTAEKAPATVAPADKVKAPKKAKATPAVESVPAVVAPVEGEVVKSSASVKLAEYAEKIGQLSSLISSLKADFKGLEKVVAKELKDAEKGHTIHPDAAMRNVLGVKDGEILTYRNIQSFLYKLYLLPEKKKVATA
jgi:vancomycin resistance protein YoaR